MLARTLHLPPPKFTLQPPAEWLPRLRTVLERYPQDDLSSTEALCCRMVGDFTAGIVLHRLLYWLTKGIREDGAIWKADREWYAELNLSYAQMQRVRAKIAPIVKSWVAKAQGAPTFHYQLRVEALVQGVASVLNRPTMEVKLLLLEKVENGFSAESKMDSRQSPESITNHPQSLSDERSKIYLSYQMRFVGFTPQVGQKLDGYLERLGAATLRQVLERCATSGGKSWQYVLAALQNTQASAAPAAAPAKVIALDEAADETVENVELIPEPIHEAAPLEVDDPHWKTVKSVWKVNYGEAWWRTYVQPLRLAAVDGGLYTFVAPNAHVQACMARMISVFQRELSMWNDQAVTVAFVLEDSADPTLLTQDMGNQSTF